MKFTKAPVILTVAIFISSCVSTKQYKETLSEQQQCETNLAQTKKEADSLSVLSNERQANIDKLSKEKSTLISDSAISGENLRQLKNKYSALDSEHDLLLERQKMMESGSEADKKKLAELFHKSQTALVEQETMLRKMSAEIEKKEQDLHKAQIDLKQREKRTNELESIIYRKDSAVKALKQHIADALIGFKNSGLTVEQRNGKVYVSVDEKLLFQSGSWIVDAKGQDALKKLSKALETQAGINIMVEGHTDNVAFSGSNQVKDNWDLSVMRATAITKLILTDSKLKPNQVTAAGRSEYLPVEKANTPEARQKNRRTEIIISPKVDELLKILETN